MGMCEQSSQDSSSHWPQESLHHRPGWENIPVSGNHHRLKKVCWDLWKPAGGWGQCDGCQKQREWQQISPCWHDLKTWSSLSARRESTEESLIKRTGIWLWAGNHDTNSAKETDSCLSTEKGIKPGFVADDFACFFQRRGAGQAAVLGHQQSTWVGLVQKGVMCAFLIRMLWITFVVSQTFWVVAPCYSHFTNWCWGKGPW